MGQANSPDKLLMHVELEYEAKTLNATLREKGIPAYWKATPSTGILGMPGAMGVPENGYDVFVTEDTYDKAFQVANSLGYGMTAEEKKNAVEVKDGEEPDVDPPKYTEEQLREDIAKLPAGKRIGFYVISTVILLTVMSLFIWGVDAVIAFIKGLF